MGSGGIEKNFLRKIKTKVYFWNNVRSVNRNGDFTGNPDDPVARRTDESTTERKKK